MLVIRLRTIGKKHQRSFRVVVDERRHKVQGKNVEDLGWYSPRTDKYELNPERVNYWLSQGANPSDTVHNLLVKAHIIKGKKRAVHSISKKKAEVTAPASAHATAGKPAA